MGMSQMHSSGFGVKTNGGGGAELVAVLPDTLSPGVLYILPDGTVWYRDADGNPAEIDYVHDVVYDTLSSRSFVTDGVAHIPRFRANPSANGVNGDESRAPYSFDFGYNFISAGSIVTVSGWGTGWAGESTQQIALSQYTPSSAMLSPISDIITVNDGDTSFSFTLAAALTPYYALCVIRVSPSETYTAAQGDNTTKTTQVIGDLTQPGLQYQRYMPVDATVPIGQGGTNKTSWSAGAIPQFDAETGAFAEIFIAQLVEAGNQGLVTSEMVNAAIAAYEAGITPIGGWWLGKTQTDTTMPTPADVLAAHPDIAAGTILNYFDFTANTPYVATPDGAFWTANTPIADAERKMVVISLEFVDTAQAGLGGLAFSDADGDWAYAPFQMRAPDMVTITLNEQGQLQAPAIPTLQSGVAANAEAIEEVKGAYLPLTGGALTGDLTIAAPNKLIFGNDVTRQQIVLYDASTDFGMGVQPSTVYQRVIQTGAHRFFLGGEHSGTAGDPGATGTEPALINNSGLTARGAVTINSAAKQGGGTQPTGTASLYIRPTAPDGTAPVSAGAQVTARVSTGRAEAAGLWGNGGLQFFGSGEAPNTLYELLVSADSKTTTPPAGLGGLANAWTETTEVTVVCADSPSQGIVFIPGVHTPADAKAAFLSTSAFAPAVAGHFTLGTAALPWGMMYAPNVNSFQAKVVGGVLDTGSIGVSGIVVNGTGDYTLTLGTAPKFLSAPNINGGVARDYTCTQDGTTLRYVFTDSSGAVADTDFTVTGV
jgi:hypothetical protein